MCPERFVTYVSGMDRKRSGGDKGIRTPDPFHAMEVLYQLSYIPTCGNNSKPQKPGGIKRQR